MNFEILKKHKTFEGETVFCEHDSAETKTKMRFSYYKPNAEKIETIILWLSGLTCTEENFITKAGAQNVLTNKNAMIVCPDTSPRGLDLPGEHDIYDFGSGAGFYLNATTEKYRDHYKMYDYILNELVPLLKSSFQPQRFSLSGHSMGGHGALVLGLRNPDIFERVSAFSPIVNPTQVPWGKKALLGYLGNETKEWLKYDACELLKAGNLHPQKILIDQGTSDEFLEEQLTTDRFTAMAKEVGQSCEVRMQDGYDHSYYFISTFIRDHIDHLIGA